MKFQNFLLNILLLGFVIPVYSDDAEAETYEYREEFRGLLASSEVHRTIFAKVAPELDDLKEIRSKIENYKHKSTGYGVLPMILAGGVTVTSESLPKLHALVEHICTANSMAMPKIFISVYENFFNAAASRLLFYRGNIIIGQQLLEELSDSMLEAVIAHELGHVKYNHINKTIALNLLCLVPMSYLYLKYRKANSSPRLDGYVRGALATIMAQLLIGKRFERQADEFAYKNAQKGPGLLKAFYYMDHRSKQKIEAREAALAQAYTEIQEAKLHIGDGEYGSLRLQYILKKMLFNLNKAYQWLYHNTRLGPHPSMEERQRVIQEYLNEQHTSLPEHGGAPRTA